MINKDVREIALKIVFGAFIAYLGFLIGSYSKEVQIVEDIGEYEAQRINDSLTIELQNEEHNRIVYEIKSNLVQKLQENENYDVSSVGNDIANDSVWAKYIRQYHNK